MRDASVANSISLAGAFVAASDCLTVLIPYTNFVMKQMSRTFPVSCY